MTTPPVTRHLSPRSPKLCKSKFRFRQEGASLFPNKVLHTRKEPEIQQERGKVGERKNFPTRTFQAEVPGHRRLGEGSAVG